jgi:hypothetical protein
MAMAMLALLCVAWLACPTKQRQPPGTSETGFAELDPWG